MYEILPQPPYPLLPAPPVFPALPEPRQPERAICAPVYDLRPGTAIDFLINDLECTGKIVAVAHPRNHARQHYLVDTALYENVVIVWPDAVTEAIAPIKAATTGTKMLAQLHSLGLADVREVVRKRDTRHYVADVYAYDERDCALPVKPAEHYATLLSRLPGVSIVGTHDSIADLRPDRPVVNAQVTFEVVS